MADPAFAENPWTAEFWNLTQQGAYIRKYGLEVAKTKAKQAGTKLGAPRPAAPVSMFTRNFVLIKKIGDTSGGSGGLIGAGSSGDGPPS